MPIAITSWQGGRGGEGQGGEGGEEEGTTSDKIELDDGWPESEEKYSKICN